MAKSKARKRRNQERRQAEKLAASKRASDYAAESWFVRWGRRLAASGKFSILDAPKDYDAALASYGMIGPGGPNDDLLRYHKYDDGEVLTFRPSDYQPDGTVAEFLVKIELGDRLPGGQVEVHLRADGSILEGDNVPDEWVHYFTPPWWNCTTVLAESRFDGEAEHTVHLIYEGSELTCEEAEWVVAHIHQGTSLSARQIVDAARAVRQ